MADRPLKKPPSSNWLVLQKKLPKPDSQHAKKRRKMDNGRTDRSSSVNSLAALAQEPELEEPVASTSDLKSTESLLSLRKMVHGELPYTEAQNLPGKYLAIDCEMVGVGIDGTESSLARVTLVNFYGAVQMDEFVRQRERVVDYRTRYSGIRESDMFKAKPFDDVQKRVAELLTDRILVGHAVHNDLKVLLLSHPRHQIRDTQYYAGKFQVSKSRFVALRNLVQQELGIAIQEGEHSSLTDARATMAVYRLHRKEWEVGAKQMSSKKRKKTDDPPKEFSGGGRKGVSSGLSIVKRKAIGSRKPGSSEEKPWWKEMGASAKGSIRL